MVKNGLFMRWRAFPLSFILPGIKKILQRFSTFANENGMSKKFLDFFISLSSEHLVFTREKSDDCLNSSRCAAILMTYISVFLLCVVTAALKIVGFFFSIFHLNSIKTKCYHMFNAKNVPNN